MRKHVAGVIMYCKVKGRYRVFLVTPGGPLYKNREEWGIPKGHLDGDEEPIDAAKRELKEETGLSVKKGRLFYVGRSSRPGKTLYAYGYQASGKEKFKGSKMFTMEWPKGSGKMKEFPEIRDGKWFDIADAMLLVPEIQRPLLEKLFLS